MLVRLLLQGLVHVVDRGLSLQNCLQVGQVFLEGTTRDSLGELPMELVHLTLEGGELEVDLMSTGLVLKNLLELLYRHLVR